MQKPAVKASLCMVGLRGFKLNSELAQFIKEHPGYEKATMNNTRHVRKWRIRQRLSAKNIAALVAASKAGAPKWQLAQRYGISMWSVKKLLREEGVKRTAC